MRRCALGGLVLLLAVTAAAFSQARASAWSGYPTRNTPICTAPSGQRDPGIVTDGSGGAIITWQDARDGASQGVGIYAQKVDSRGRVQWAADGVAICAASGNQYSAPRIVSDGSGGAIITWEDVRGGVSNSDVYAQRVDSNGALLWTADGAAICSASGGQGSLQITSDGLGGAIIVWEDRRGGSPSYDFDIYAQRVDPGGNVRWSADGVPVCTASDLQARPQITSDGSGGAIMTWEDLRSDGTHIYAQRVDADGSVRWTADGVAACTASLQQIGPQIIPDGSAGAIITWADHRGPNLFDIYAQRVDAGGGVLWTDDGMPVNTAPGSQSSPQIVPDSSGGAIITWENGVNGYDGIYAQKVDSNGAAQWTVDGVVICTAPGHRQPPSSAPDGSGGAIIAWTDSRNGSWSIYAQRVDAGGRVQWTADGVPISTVPGEPHYAACLSDGSGGAIVTWDTARDSSSDIHAGKVASSRILADTEPPEVTLASTAASPANASPIPVTVTFSEPVTGFAVDDVEVGNGTAGNLMAVNLAVYTFEVAPKSEGLVTVSLAGGVARDSAGNGNTPSTPYSVVFDSVPPSVTMASTASEARASPIPLTVTFSENVTGFDIDDIVVANGNARNLAAVSGSVYTLDVTPAGAGQVTVSLAAGAARDSAGNGSLAAELSTSYTPQTPSSPANWGLIGGIIAAVVVLSGAGAWLILSRRRS